MSENDPANTDLLYRLHDRPTPLKASLGAIQHVLAAFVGIITPSLIIGGTLGLGEHIPYLLSMSLIVSGVATFIQTRKVGPVGSGLMALQGTSFGFLAAVLTAGFVVKNRGGGPEEILSVIFGVSFLGAFVEIFLSQFITKLKSFMSPIVTGCVIVTIGLSLTKVGLTDLAGGFGAEDFGSIPNLLLGGGVLASVVLISIINNKVIRSSAIFIGLMLGLLAAMFMGRIDFSLVAEAAFFTVPIPFKYGFGFDWQAFIPVAFMYIITSIETSGDLTATSMISGEPIKGPLYEKRIKGGVLGDGVNSLIAAVFNTFPVTTFSQNNGVIQMTGIASRYVGFYVAGILCLMGLFPILGAIFTQLPKPVVGGVTLLMFATVATAGIRILSTVNFTHRNVLIIATSLGLATGIAFVPDVLSQTPQFFQNIFGSAVTMSGIVAITLDMILPKNYGVEFDTAAQHADDGLKPIREVA
ncbi:MAG: purine permease [Psychrobacter sp.]|jgi:xanthine permease XanP|uniref:Nucleobase:cation symporter-2 family protein n=1 Tax=Psychrobacter namhaensis TaxID=292734 RepID=A0ABW8L664_9GAMM|nr:MULTISPECIES: nucleobase:cation symporter-2 family protein [Psychrobacter]MCD6251238.1 purine permease [Psychrobacter sp.]HCN16845.1 xanthine permease XanP [Psychrobacter sp.]|tara:strand:- start:2019 stop:3425 length:1407 start_codon:yes stop_codon:yes gene_type:complete